jgi:hypothetical protein
MGKIQGDREGLRGLGREGTSWRYSTWFYRMRHGRNHPLTIGNGRDVAEVVMLDSSTNLITKLASGLKKIRERTWSQRRGAVVAENGASRWRSPARWQPNGGRRRVFLLFSGVGPTHQSHTERVRGLGWLGWLSGPDCWAAVLFFLSLFFCSYSFFYLCFLI